MLACRIPLIGSLNAASTSEHRSLRLQMNDDINVISSEALAAASAAIGKITPLSRCYSPGAKIGAAVQKWPNSNRDHCRDETATVRPFQPGGVLGEPKECSSERLRPPQIMGEVENPVLESVRRLWWRAIDRVCDFFTLRRLSIQDRIYGPEPPTPADFKREADHERLARGLSGDRRNDRAEEMPCRAKSSGEIGSP